MKLSHSKLSTILSCPMSYYLMYEQGISKKIEKSAFAIGSAVHWGIEHNTEDLSEYWGKNADYGRDQLLSEAMVHGYLKNKDKIFEKLLKDPVTGEKLTLVDEYHEVKINGALKSFKYNTHDFVGIIDLLLLTDKGFVLIDYKTSSSVPSWDSYLDQIYRYIFLLKSEFPDVPIVKIGIINIRKTGIRQKKAENMSEFLNRMKFEYELNDEEYVNYHEFAVNTLDQTRVNDYIDNMSTMADAAETIVKNETFFINYAAANGMYRSDFWDIFYHTPDAHLLYKIRDHIWDKDENRYLETRDCVPLDMKVIDLKLHILNKYDTFKSVAKSILEPVITTDMIIEYCKEMFITDDSLLEKYAKTYEHELAEKS